MWLVTTVAIITMLWLDVRDTGRYSLVRNILNVGYVAALLWYLARSGPSISQLPKIRPFVFQRWKYGPWIPVLGLILIVTLIALSDDGLLILILVSVIATVWILLVWRREIKLRAVIQALAVALFAYLGSLRLLDGFFSETLFYLLLMFAAPMYIAGGLLVTRSGLGGVQLWANQYRHVFRSIGAVQCRRWFTRLGYNLDERILDAGLAAQIPSHYRRNLVQIIARRGKLLFPASSFSNTPCPANSWCSSFQRDHVWPAS
jgi:hypothetical protein